jgi:F-type H+-transporting ATPase subunit alpha
LLEKIAGGDWEDSTQEELDAAIKEFADDFGYDLDEEGNPVEEGDSDRVTERASSDEEAGEEAEEAEKEAATA